MCIKIQIKVCIFLNKSILNLINVQILKNSKIFLWKKRRFRLRWDSSPGLSIAGSRQWQKNFELN